MSGQAISALCTHRLDVKLEHLLHVRWYLGEQHVGTVVPAGVTHHYRPHRAGSQDGAPGQALRLEKEGEGGGGGGGGGGKQELSKESVFVYIWVFFSFLKEGGGGRGGRKSWEEISYIPLFANIEIFFVFSIQLIL